MYQKWYNMSFIESKPLWSYNNWLPNLSTMLFLLFYLFPSPPPLPSLLPSLSFLHKPLQIDTVYISLRSEYFK